MPQRSTFREWSKVHKDAVKVACREWMASRAEEARRCHACGGEVAPLEPVCPHCGSGEPAQLRIPVAAVVAFSVGVVLLMLALLT